jgi:protein-S-isoprenylcysteine O-methyltransferase Ste14
MSFIPAFQIGVWNAWIFLIWPLIQDFGFRLSSKDLYTKAGIPSDMKPSNKYKILGLISTTFWLLGTTYSIFLPFKLDTIWFPIGLVLFLLGFVISVVSSFDFIKTPLNEPVTRGVYAYSRHPIYLSLVLIFLGASIASISWVFLIITVLMAVLITLSVADEELFCLQKYGDIYRVYMAKTPRWIGIPK